MEFIELLTVTTEKGEGVLLEECGRQYRFQGHSVEVWCMRFKDSRRLI